MQKPAAKSDVFFSPEAARVHIQELGGPETRELKELPTKTRHEVCWQPTVLQP